METPVQGVDFHAEHRAAIEGLRHEFGALREQVGPKPFSWTTWIPIGLTTMGMFVACLVWLLSTLATKADAGEVRQIEKYEVWVAGALNAIANKVGVELPPVPSR